MADPADIPFDDIENRVREDCELVGAQVPSQDKVRQFIRDAYKDIIDKRPDARVRNDGTVMEHFLASDVVTLKWELIEFILSFVFYVKWRVRSMNKMEPNQRSAAADDWRDYMTSLGFSAPPQQQG